MLHWIDYLLVSVLHFPYSKSLKDEEKLDKLSTSVLALNSNLCFVTISYFHFKHTKCMRILNIVLFLRENVRASINHLLFFHFSSAPKPSCFWCSNEISFLQKAFNRFQIYIYIALLQRVLTKESKFSKITRSKAGLPHLNTLEQFTKLFKFNKSFRWL